MKCNRHEPVLNVDEATPLRTDLYALVQMDEAARKARYLGWCGALELEAAPRVVYPRIGRPTRALIAVMSRRHRRFEDAVFG